MTAERTEHLRAYQRDYQRKWRKENPEKQSAYNKQFSEKNPGLRNELTKAWRNNHPDYKKYRREYERDWLVTSQAKKAGRPKPSTCEVCGGEAKKICFDRCHQSGEFRGWICDHCNKVLGLARDNPETLEKLVAYLRAKQ